VWVAEANGTEAFSLLAALGAAAPTLSLGTGVIPVQVDNTPIPRGNAPIRMGASRPGIRAPHFQGRTSHPGMATVPIRMAAFPTWMATPLIRMATVPA